MIARTVRNGMAAVAGLLLALSTIGAAHADGLLAEIKERGKLTVGTEAALEPFEFVQDGKIVGYNKDILNAIVADLGVELNQLNLPFQGILPGLLAKKFDFVATSVGINAERAAKYAYTRPIGSFDNVIVVRADEDDIKSPDDLNGKVVATQMASSPQPVAEAHSASLKEKGGEGYAELKLYTAFPETHVALASGQVDAIVLASPTAAVLMKKQPDTFRVVGTIGEPQYLAWVTRPEDKDVREYINSKIDALNDSGKLKEWQMKWFGFTFATPKEGYLPEGAL
ncbi:transporter substrate-binding domain-containing protein [Rhodoligotrophos ferricapiens]|uniref:transporter substrate-binding domain-containing protein n=1 Tax=Rhodoligotrophos ferricapiens TaxID=3069264 RepID=UPI00315D1EAF